MKHYFWNLYAGVSLLISNRYVDGKSLYMEIWLPKVASFAFIGTSLIKKPIIYIVFKFIENEADKRPI